MGQERTRSGPGAHQECARSAPGVGHERTRSGPGEHQEQAKRASQPHPHNTTPPQANRQAPNPTRARQGNTRPKHARRNHNTRQHAPNTHALNTTRKNHNTRQHANVQSEHALPPLATARHGTSLIYIYIYKYYLFILFSRENMVTCDPSVHNSLISQTSATPKTRCPVPRKRLHEELTKFAFALFHLS